MKSVIMSSACYVDIHLAHQYCQSINWQESLADAKVNEQQKCMDEDP